MVKNRIDSLIEREYLERADNDRTTLVYKPWNYNEKLYIFKIL
jgi:hypothetical protein